MEHFALIRDGRSWGRLKIFAGGKECWDHFWQGFTCSVCDDLIYTRSDDRSFNFQISLQDENIRKKHH